MLRINIWYIPIYFIYFLQFDSKFKAYITKTIIVKLGQYI